MNNKIKNIEEYLNNKYKSAERIEKEEGQVGRAFFNLVREDYPDICDAIKKGGITPDKYKCDIENFRKEFKKWIKKYEAISKITPTDEQQKAIDLAIEFSKNKSKMFSIIGGAGTGKTTIMKYVIYHYELNSINYTLCAPTHKAKNVLKAATGREATTIHSLLKLSPKLDVEKLDMRNLEFCMPDLMKDAGVLIIDEASMVNDNLCAWLQQKYKKILVIGDEKQLAPVKQNEVSMVFKNENSVRLETIHRQAQDSPLMTVLSDLRDGMVYDFDNPSIKIFNDVYSFADNAAKYFSDCLDEKEFPDSCLIAYTNSAVDQYNKYIHDKLFGEDVYIGVGELLLANDNNKDKDITNGDYFVVESVKPTKVKSSDLGVTYDCFDVVIRGEDDSKKSVTILSEKNDPFAIRKYIELVETTRINAIQEKSKPKKQITWVKYFNLLSMFQTIRDMKYQDQVVKKASFKFGYSITAHKSQGSSYSEIYMDMNNMLMCFDPELLRQLVYVGLSRTRTTVNMYYTKC